MKPVHTFPFYFTIILLILSYLLRLGLPRCLLPSRFSEPNFESISNLSHACYECPAHPILLDLIALIIFGKAYML